MNLSLKHKLMLQSLSPLAFLTIVRNFKFTPVSELAENQSYWGEFVRLNNVLIVVFLLCATWILAAIISFISFTAFQNSGKRCVRDRKKLTKAKWKETQLWIFSSPS
ncbi:hypothetical protein [Blautia fusiformis]|uniref:Uncharacterized protein n=1 Tax=Blautia fusiformis TaxID=2881264 RepID=A0AAW4WA96_9FIRM|nr:hypothetical protein [Blautia fusiformis]MCC2228589.1 hypothetical protein [Blautia fusiformis]